MQRHKRVADSRGFEPPQQVGGEVQARPSERPRPRLARKDGLITLAIGGQHLAVANVRRQRHAAESLEQRERRLVRFGVHHPNAPFQSLDEPQPNVILPRRVDEGDRFAEGHLAARASQEPPQAFVIAAEKQPFPMPAGHSAIADEPGRHDPRVVEDEQIAASKNLRQDRGYSCAQANRWPDRRPTAGRRPDWPAALGRSDAAAGRIRRRRVRTLRNLKSQILDLRFKFEI